MIRRARRAALGLSTLVFCPDPTARLLLETLCADRGGVQIQTCNWDELFDLLEDHLSLRRVKIGSEAARIAALEHALTGHLEPSLGAATALAIESNANAIARALLPTVDTLRSYGWTRAQSDAIVDEAVAKYPSEIAAPLRMHLSLLACAIDALEVSLADSGSLDFIRRARRIVDALSTQRVRVGAPFAKLFVHGVDWFSPLEAGLMAELRSAGTEIDVAPWTCGLTSYSPRVIDNEQTVACGLDALARAPHSLGAEAHDDSIVESAARDPHEAVERVADWLEEMAATERNRVAIVAPRGEGSVANVVLALQSRGIVCRARSAISTQSVPLWSVVRAVIRLRWRGPSMLDLATVLAAPGAGIWGADRDRLTARVRVESPRDWAAFRQLVIETTDPEKYGLQKGARDAPEDEPKVPDPERIASLLTQRAHVLALVQELEGSASFAALEVKQRLESLKSVSAWALKQFAQPERLRRSIDDERLRGLWVRAAVALREAFAALFEQLERAPASLMSRSSASLLAQLEHALPSLADDFAQQREDAVEVIGPGSRPTRRPQTLIVLGFSQGSYPSPVAALPWLGAAETAALATSQVAPSLATLSSIDRAKAITADRDLLRLLASPTQKLITVHLVRGVAGAKQEPSSSRATLLSAYREAIGATRDRVRIRSLREVLTVSGVTQRAQRDMLAARLHSLDESLVDLVDARIKSHPDELHFFRSALDPSRDFALGSVLRPIVGQTVFRTSDLELATKCAFAFATRAMLHVRWLKLGTSRQLAYSTLIDVASEVLHALDQAPDAQLPPLILEALKRHAPYASALDREETLRTMLVFLQSFRARHGAVGPALAAPLRECEPLTLTLDGERDEEGLVIQVQAPLARIENGDAGATVIDLRLGRASKESARIELGVGASAAVLPLVAERTIGAKIHAIETVSLSHGDSNLMSDSPKDDRPTLAAIAMRAKRTVHTVLREILSDNGSARPHDRARHAALAKAKIRSCEGCPSRLLCRFDLPGELP
ncbi:MAG: hypothetical protein Q8Q09_12855 [Deltaproteobacteria bacterium]|nr:hypothetical protein [Deltaproteobacteria bacterium]